MKKLFIVFILMFFVSIAVKAQPTWTLQTGPNTGDINSAWVVDANVVWMCGPAGKVIRTTNGGTTWALANTGLTGNDFLYSFCY